ncbi:hypothetical protein, variant [Aphanomyces invadans]|uniref:Calmodulin n=1 Tax=Aphanomyces invadans TaxID=157072 RepID=A0A024UVR0_9STRA|nr:hypothetical protein, variant [Aphanomyces invadans]ETW10012.1 hypothetical protein, variant [Aphanomyces invadans]|eukprot:XP_008861423.1 hypothetical protein, variant [Aphanomyces invadans]
MSRLPRPGGKLHPSDSKKNKGGGGSGSAPGRWVDGGNVADTCRIPPYDSTKDKHVGLAPKISPSKKGARPTTSITTQPVHQASDTSIIKAPAHRGNITFESDVPGNGGMELDVLKAIILREDYLSRLADMSKSASQYTLVGSMANTLDLIRLTTVEVVETIATWRKQQPKHMPFKWNGINYLLKVPSDLDFMQECDVMVRWLGFSFERNPFVMPDSLDSRSQVFEPGRAATPTTTSMDDPFLPVGGLPVAASPMSPTTAAGRSKGKTAYETRILNDDDLLPRPKPATLQGTAPSASLKAKPTVVLPSQVGDLDVLRIREAEKLLLEEEALFGRYKRDLYGRLVPEAVALQQAKTSSIYQNHTRTSLEGPPSSTAINPLSSLAASPLSAPATHAIVPSKGNEKLTGSIKQAGMLAPPTKFNMQGRIRPPMKRSRGAKMEEELEKTIAANKVLEYHIAVLRDAIATHQAASRDGMSPQHRSSSTLATDAPTLAMLQRDLDAQIEEYERKKREIVRKQEAMEAFKHAQKSAVENARLAELLRKQQMDEAQILAEKVKLVQIYKATHIQKIVRGILARKEYKTIRIKYTIASTYIEAAVRGFLARRRVFKLFHRRKAAIKIQTIARGMFARNATCLERMAQKQRKASVVIQKTYRGRLGRHRMRHFRSLHSAKLRLIYLTEHLCTDELVEMGRLLCAYSKHPESKYTVKPSHVVLGLVRILMSACFSCLSPKDKLRLEQPIHEVRWMEAGQFLRRASALLRKLHTMAASAGRVMLPLSSETLALIQAYRHDKDFSLAHFATQGALAKTSSTLCQWIQAMATISDVQHVFLEPTPALELNLDDHADEDRAELKACELEDHHSQRQFVPLSLIQDCPKRPRPLLIILSRDIPGHAKHLLVQNMMMTFPGLFLHISSLSSIDIQTIQQTFDAGYSVLYDADIGLSVGQQRKFLGQISIVAKALRPSPLNILVQGDLGNRAGQGDVNVHGVAETDLHQLADKDAKYHAQVAADGLDALTNGRMFVEMMRTSLDDRPNFGLVFVMEAILILLTPTQRYHSPDLTTSTVTWRLSRRLLATPDLFAAKLTAVDMTCLPIDNVMVLKAYIEHASWPTANTSHGSLMHRLAQFTHAMVQFALHIHANGGCAKRICRAKPIPGLFSSVITVTDPSPDDPSYKTIFAKLACAILDDVRVYRESKKIGDRLYILTLYRDCHRVYVSCYDPATSMLWKVDVPEADMNTLLAPNSIEVLQQKKPPRNPKELYKSIVGYCRLSKPRGRDPSVQLELRPRAMRLCRLARKIHGHFATITVSEVAMGHLRLDIHIHDSFSSKTVSWTVHVDDDELQKLKLNATDPIESTAYNDLDVQTMYRYVLDRVHIEHRRMTLPRTHHFITKPAPSTLAESPAELRVRVRQHGGSGRLLRRQVVFTPQTKVKWVLSVFVLTWTGAIRLEAYRPDNSSSMNLGISHRERRELLLAEPTKRLKRRPLHWVQALLDRVVVSTSNMSLDRTLDCVVLQLSYYPPIYSEAVPKSERSVRAICHVDLAVMPHDNYGLHVMVYLPCVSHTHLIVLSDAEVQAIVESPWPCTDSVAGRRRAIRAIFQLCTYDTNERLVRLEAPGCFVKYATMVAPPVMSLDSTSAQPATPQRIDDTPVNRPLSPADVNLLANTVRMLDEGSDNLVYVYDVAQTLHTGTYRCNGTLLSATLTMMPILKPVVEPNKPGLPDVHTSVNSFVLSLRIYNPEMSQHCDVTIDGMQDLREVTGPDEAHLIGSKTVLPWLHHVMTSRLDRTIHPDGTFTVVLVRSRMYSEYKATPVYSTMDEDVLHNKHLLIDDVDKRGVKITSKAKHIRGHAVICSAFDITLRPPADGSSAAFDRALHVHVRIDGYIATTSQNLSVWVQGAVLMEAVGSHVALLELGNERALAEHLFDLLDLEVSTADGHPSTICRLFIKETIVHLPKTDGTDDGIAANVESTTATSSAPSPCLYKTFCAVSGEKVLVSVLDTSHTTPAVPLRVMLYQPSSSLTTHVDVPSDFIEKVVPSARASWTSKAQVHAALRQLLSYLSVTRVEDECGTTLSVGWKDHDSQSAAHTTS